MRTRRLSPRAILLALAGLAALAAAGGYAFLVATTANQPGPAALPSAPSGSPVAFSATDPDGTWVIDPDGSSFVGYRAKELLAVDFVASPNEAVGRTSDVTGSIEIADGKLASGEITAQVLTLRSNEELRDSHVVEGLQLDAHPAAMFHLRGPVDISSIARGRAASVTVDGDLSIRDVTRPVSIAVDARWDGGSISIAGSTTIHRADFGLEMPQLLAFRVADDVTLEFELTLVPSCAPSCVAGVPTPSRTPRPSAEPTPTASPTSSGKLVSTKGQLVLAGVTDHGENAPSTGEIYVVGADGGGLRQVTHQDAFAEYPAWSPDGRSIAYTSRQDERELGLWVVAATGGTPIQVAKQPARHPAWSSTSDAIAFVSPPEVGGVLSIVNADGSGLHDVALPPGVADDPVWSPDGRHLTFTFFPKGANRESVYIANADGTHPHPFIEAGTYSYAASWSADSKRLVFVLDGQVAVASADGSGVKAVTAARAVDRPCFSPDGDRIVFTQNDGVYVMNGDGTGVTALTVSVDHAGFATWRPSPGR